MTNSPPPRIGVLVDGIGEGYSRSILRGAFEAAAERALSILLVPGGRLESNPEQSLAGANVAYLLPGPENVCGIVLLAGALLGERNVYDLDALRRSFGSVPVVSIGLDLPDVPAVGVDDVAAMSEIAQHVARAGAKRIAFIAGPDGSQESAARFVGFLRGLESAGLEADVELVKSGDFSEPSGRLAALELLDAGRPFDAILCANDHTAVGALAALRMRGVRVPEDVLITGFDDLAIARASEPSITTARQPLQELGRTAVHLLTAMMAGEPVPPRTSLVPELQPRASTSRGAPRDFLRIESMSDDVVLSDPRLHPHAFLLDVPLESLVPEVEARCRHALRSGEDVSDIILLLALRRAGEERSGRDANDPYLEHAEVITLSAERRQQQMIRMATELRFGRLGSLMGRLALTRDREEVARALEEELPRLGAADVALIEYVDREHPLRAARVHTPSPAAPALPEKPARELVRECLARSGTGLGLLLPLHFRSEPIGVLLLSTDLDLGGWYAIVQEQVSATLQRIDREWQVIRSREKEKRQRIELEQTYQALQVSQHHLVASEKLASLGRLTAGIAHEMNTPLAAARAALDELALLIEEYTDCANDPDATPEDHAEIAKLMTTKLALARRAAAGAAGFLRSIRSQTRDLAGQVRGIVDAVAAVSDALLLVEHSARAAECEVVFTHAADTMLVEAAPSRLSQIVSNLVLNAIYASRSQKSPVEVSLNEQDGSMRLEVTDRGCGIAPEHLDKIFDPMFTTKPFGQGTGLGLSIVHEIVTGELGGAIAVDSKLDVGTTFVVTIPLNRAVNP